MRVNNLVGKIHRWRLENVSHQNFILLLSLLVGLASGLAAVILKNAVFYTHLFLTQGFDIQRANFLYLAYPLLGMALTAYFVRFILKDDISHGVSRVLYAISRQNSRIKLHNTYSSMIASTLTVGFGGSVGLEAPVVYTGSSIGSNLAKAFKLDYRATTLMIGCGAAGAVAGIFKAPIAGVIFALEVIMLDLTMASLIPLLISAVTAATLSSMIMGESVLFNFPITSPFSTQNIPFYILLGIMAGMVSLYFVRANSLIETKFQEIKSPFRRMLYGGILVSLLIFLLPPLYGEGYETLADLLNGRGDQLSQGSLFYSLISNQWSFMVFIGMVLFFKVAAMAFTSAGGGIGGVFAPSLFMGGVTGFLLARFVNFMGFARLPESNFVLAGMAGVMAAVMHAPLTAIFLIAEITGGYQFFIPLIITSTISYITIKTYESHSIYARRLAATGELITHDKDQAVLTRMSIAPLIESNFLTIEPDKTLGDLVKLVAQSPRNIFPVIDTNGKFLGVVFINDIRHIIFERDLYNTTFVRDIMFMPDTLVNMSETMEQVAHKFNTTQHYNLPVLDNGKYIGFVSRANVFSKYRELVKEFSQE